MTYKNTLCFSSATKISLNPDLGSPHYSYHFAASKFLALFRAIKIQTQPLNMPEYYGSSRAISTLPKYNNKNIHVIFRSTESIRLLKRCYNIVCFAWEFPHLKDFARDGEHPFSNQRRMLSLCDEIWVPSHYTKNVLERHGLENVHWIPAPIEPPRAPKHSKFDALARLGHLDSKALDVNFLNPRSASTGTLPILNALGGRGGLEKKKIYLSVFNPEDFRKNLDAMVRGFDAFQQRHPEAVLIIKALTSRERFGLQQVVCDVMANKLRSGSSFTNHNIIVFNQYIDDDEMTALYDLADFYLCTSLAEGQNLPLLEAMARGAVPVTTRNTAMVDYVSPANSIVIETKTVPNDNRHLAGGVAEKPYDVELCDERQVFAALIASAALKPEDRASMSADALRTVEKSYAFQSVAPLVKSRLAVIAPG